jgi:23S rRNA-/tRNA-specific pseudouridylate synthase
MRVLWRGMGAVVVDKPFGLPSQSGRDGERSVLDEVVAQIPDAQSAFPVHRLDQAASGALLVALDADAARAWSEHLQRGRLSREYVAVLMGSAGDGLWDWPVDGRPARTHVQVVARRSGLTAVSLRIETGRTHQIRRHAAMAGCPIAGDRRYGVEAGRRWPRLALHAARLVLPDGTTVDAPLPADLTVLWQDAGAGQNPVTSR